MVRLRSTRTVIIAVPGAGQWIQAMYASGRRTGIIISSIPATGVHVANAPQSVNDPGFIYTGTLNNPIMAYEDFGNLIRDEIWIMTQGGAISASVTEFFYVG